MQREFIPLVKPVLPTVTDELLGQIKDLLESGMLTKGRYLTEFEATIADYLNVKHVVATSSCTLGLLLTYSGLGLGKRDEVLVPSFTFMATVHPLMWVGAKPVLVDIDPDTWNISIEHVKRSITDRTSAIVAVHNFGNPAQIVELAQIASEYGLKLIFDSAHGFGTSYRGTQVGSFGDAEVFSLSPTKLLIGGEGGVVATDNEQLAEYVRVGREYGNSGDYGSDFPGLNARLTEFNALLAMKCLANLEFHVAERNRVANLFREGLKDVPGVQFQLHILDEEFDHFCSIYLTLFLF